MYHPAYSTEISGTNLSPSFITGNIGAPLEFHAEDDGDSGDEEGEEVIVKVPNRPFETSVGVP